MPSSMSVSGLPGKGERPSNGRVKLSPEAAKSLPEFVLELLGPEALPEGINAGSAGKEAGETSLPELPENAAPMAAGKNPAGLPDEAGEKLLAAITPLAEEFMAAKEQDDSGNPRNALLKARMKSIMNRRKSRERKTDKAERSAE